VHAVLVLEAGADGDAVVRDANRQLSPHQRIRSASIWPAGELPRTEGTRKLKRRQIREWVEAGGRPESAEAMPGGASVPAVVARFARGHRGGVGPQTTIDELGLSSLERVELLMALEERFETTLDEAAVASARTVGDLEALLAEAAGRTPGGAPAALAAGAGGPQPAGTGRVADARGAAREDVDGPIGFPRWNRRAPAWWLRRVSLPTWILPSTRIFARVTVRGLEHLDGLDGPVVFAANHQSHFDAPVMLRALPARWRYHVAIAMAKEFFAAHFFPERAGRRAWLTNSLNYYLASLFFNAFPLPQREAGTRQTLRYIGRLLGEGYSLLIFPEGKRTDAGEINVFRPGIGMIGSRLQVPVVPVRLVGLDRILHHRWRWPQRGPALVVFGAPLTLDGDDYVALAKQVEDAVRRLA
jgi:long-chain acyl-CoA synthetase